MKKILKYILISLTYPFIKKLGFVKLELQNKTDKNWLLNNLINILKNCGFEPKLVIDVGSNHGTWSRVWKSAFPKASFILIDPQHWLKKSFDDLLDSDTMFYPIGLGDQNGSFLFTINSDRDDSSTFTLTSEQASTLGFKQIEVPVKTLNSLLLELGNKIPDIIKIDAEGNDLKVLEGASDCFGKTEIFLVEASFNSEFTQTDLIEILKYMDSKGYKPFDITDINRPFSNKVLWLVEIAFIKKGGFLDNLKWN